MKDLIRIRLEDEMTPKLKLIDERLDRSRNVGYIRLHAGRSILWSARAHITAANPFGAAMARRLLDEKVDEIEREIEAMKR